MTDFLEFKKRINATDVSLELLGDAMATIAALPSDQRGVFETRATCVVDLLSKKGYDENSGFLAMAIAVRLMALDSIMDDPWAKQWLLPGPNAETTDVSADLLRAAVTEPVVEDSNRQPAFVGHSFFQRLLETAASRGQG